MTTGWMLVPLGDVLTLQRGFDLPTSQRSDGQIPVVSSSGITGLHSEAKVLAPGVVTGRYGTLGQVFFLEEDFWPLNTTLFVRDFKGNDPQFISYLLRTLNFEALNDKSSVPGLNRNHLHEIVVSIPISRQEQRAIAHILGTLDDKIELNRQMNQTLDEIARTLFRSWFVDFDPVRAKAEGRQPEGMDAETAALFPDRFVDSELGPIPEGWRATTLGDVIEIHDSKRVPLSSQQRAKRRGPFPYYGATSIMDYVDEYLFDGVYLLVGEDGSVINDDQSPIVQYVWGQFWVNNHAHVLTPAGEISTEHLALALRHSNIAPFVTGAVQAKVSQGNLRRVPILRASDLLNARFAQLIAPLFSGFRANSEESLTMAALRDTLLPELLSGRITVPMKGEMVGAVG